MKLLSLPICLSLLCGTLIFSTTLYAQQKCATDDLMQHMREHDPQQAAQIDEQRRRIFELANSQQFSSRDSHEIYTIPVVFHVVWNDSSENNF